MTTVSKSALITGFPNLVAVKFCEALLRHEPATRVTLLLMEKHRPLALSLLPRLSASEQKRLTIMTGDVTALDLGLSGAEIRALTVELTHILHAAHVWHIGAGTKTCWDVNVNGTQHVLDLAKDCSRLERLAYFSTLFVSGDRKGSIREDEFWVGQRFKNTFEKTRFAGERLARKAMAKGLPLTVFRVGWVTGDSRTGEILRFEGPYLLLKALLKSEANLPVLLPGMCEAPSNIVPIDYVIDACRHVLSKPETVGSTYHLTDPFPLSARSVFEAVSAYLGCRQPTCGLPPILFQGLLALPRMERFAGLPKDLLVYLNHKAVHNCSALLADLKGSGISCPRFESYFPMGIEYARDLLKRRLEQKEEREAVDPFDHI